MSVKVEYSGQIYLNLPKYLSIQDEFTFGQKLAQIEKTVKKRFIEMSDEELYNTLMLLINTKDYYKDELPDEDFKKEFLKQK
jgi:hypothetical protein